LLCTQKSRCHRGVLLICKLFCVYRTKVLENLVKYALRIDMNFVDRSCHMKEESLCEMQRILMSAFLCSLARSNIFVCNGCVRRREIVLV